jgi:hypothetical protein
VGADRIRRSGQPEGLRDQLVRPHTSRVVVSDRHNDDLLRAVEVGDLLDPGTNRPRRTDHDAAATRGARVATALAFGEEALGRLDGWHRDQVALAQQDHRHATARREQLGLFVGVGAQYPDRRRDARFGQPFGGREPLPVELRQRRSGGVDEVCERVGQANLRGPHRAVARGPQQPRLRSLGTAWENVGQARERVLG